MLFCMKTDWRAWMSASGMLNLHGRKDVALILCWPCRILHIGVASNPQISKVELWLHPHSKHLLESSSVNYSPASLGSLQKMWECSFSDCTQLGLRHFKVARSLPLGLLGRSHKAAGVLDGATPKGPLSRRLNSVGVMIIAAKAGSSSPNSGLLKHWKSRKVCVLCVCE